MPPSVGFLAGLGVGLLLASVYLALWGNGYILPFDTVVECLTQ